MTGRIDVHAHLIPAVDDGCSKVEESIQCARALVSAGYSTAFCTPHIWPHLIRNTPGNIVAWTIQLQSHLDNASIPLKLHPGGEVHLQPGILGSTLDHLPTYGMRKMHILVDLWADRLPDYFAPVVRRLQSLGLIVILAHPERMNAVHVNPALMDWFAELGLLLQGNLQCFSDHPDTSTRQLVERFAEEQRYFMLGTDTHGPDSIPARMEGLQRAIDLLGEKTVWKLTSENPKTLL